MLLSAIPVVALTPGFFPLTSREEPGVFAFVAGGNVNLPATEGMTMDQKNVRSSSERRPWDSTVIPCHLSDDRLKAVRHLTSVIEKAHYCTVEEEVGFYFTSGLPKRRWNVDMDLHRRDEEFPETFDLSTLQLIAFLAGIAVAEEHHRTEYYPDNLFAGARVGWDETDFGVAFIGDIRKRGIRKRDT